MEIPTLALSQNLILFSGLIHMHVQSSMHASQTETQAAHLIGQVPYVLVPITNTSAKFSSMPALNGDNAGGSTLVKIQVSMQHYVLAPCQICMLPRCETVCMIPDFYWTLISSFFLLG